MIFSALLSLSLAAMAVDTAPPPDVRAWYPRLFRLEEVREASYVGVALRVDSLAPGDPLAPLVNANPLYFDYLAEHATSPELAALVARHRDFPRLRAEYDALLRSDPVFNAAVTETAGRFLAARGTRVRGFDPSRARPVVAAGEAMETAARFFYPDELLPDGTIRTHICIDLNGVRDSRRPRSPALEAFLFAAIQGEVHDGHHGLREDFVRVRDRMNAAGLSADTTLLLSRAQGFMWAKMAESPALRETLRAAYDAWSGYLPFVIDWERPDSP
ncbi:MAG: hypothetical protein ACJ8J0_05805 [Longimicrobiaceae bacterium]